jgi:folate-binding protein YgfZ
MEDASEQTETSTAHLVTSDPAAQVAALETGVAVVDRSWTDALEISGADRRRFLTGRVTQDLASAEDGGGVYGFVTDRKGRVVSDFVLSAIGGAADGRYLLELPAGRAEVVDGMLAPYILADRVEIARRDDLSLLAVVGPEAEAFLEEQTGAAPPAEDWHHAEAELAGVPVRLVRRPLAFAVPCWTVWVAKDRAGELVEALAAAGATPVSHEAAEVARVAAGLPRWGAEFDDGHLPQETGLEEYAVSYTKGCYLGQEVVARIHYRGGVQKTTTALRFRDSSEDGPKPGADLVHDGRSVGTVGSVVRHPERGLLGLAVLHTRGREAGEVEVEGGGRAEVVTV